MESHYKRGAWRIALQSPPALTHKNILSPKRTAPRRRTTEFIIFSRGPLSREIKRISETGSSEKLYVSFRVSFSPPYSPGAQSATNSRPDSSKHVYERRKLSRWLVNPPFKSTACTRVRSLSSFLRCPIAITPIAPPVAIVSSTVAILLPICYLSSLSSSPLSKHQRTLVV